LGELAVKAEELAGRLEDILAKNYGGAFAFIGYCENSKLKRLFTAEIEKAFAEKDAALAEARSKTELRDRELDTMSRIATKYQKERDEARKERAMSNTPERAEPPVGEPMGADEAVLVLTNLMNLLWPHNPRSVAALRVVLGILRRVSASPASTASAQQRPTREQIAGLSPGAQAESGLDSMNWSFYTLGFGRAISLVLELYPPDAPAQTGSAQATCPNCEPPVKEEEKGKWCYVCEKQSKEGYTCGGGALWICQKCVAMYS
jgi:hypothetical protein